MANDPNSTIRRRRAGFSLLGVLFVALGTLLLLNTTGLVGIGIWFDLVSYWPMLLVLIGVHVFLAPRAPLVNVAVVTVILAGTVVAAALPLSTADGQRARDFTFHTPLRDTEFLTLGMGFAGGSVDIRALSERSGAQSLLSAAFSDRGVEVIEERTGRRSDIYLSTGDFRIRLGGNSRWTNGGGYARDAPLYDRGSDEGSDGIGLSGFVDWELEISPEVVLELDIGAGAADLDLDLRNLDVRRVEIGAGASDIRILLPNEAHDTQVWIAAGASDIDITVPRGVAAMIYTGSVMTSTRIDTARFPEIGGVHMSLGYHGASNRVQIEIEGGLADVDVS